MAKVALNLPSMQEYLQLGCGEDGQKRWDGELSNSCTTGVSIWPPFSPLEVTRRRTSGLLSLGLCSGSAGILVNDTMMLFLPGDTWIRLIAWLVAGLVIFFTRRPTAQRAEQAVECLARCQGRVMSELLWAWVKIGGGLAVLIGGGELLVRGASALAAAVNITPLVIGLTVVAFGTSAPELAVSLQAAFAGNADLTLGNVVGSNIFNLLFILGLSALIVPLVVSSRLIRWDVPLMIVISLLSLVVGRDGSINRWEGLGLFAGIVTYTWWCIRQSRKESGEVQAEFAQGWPRARPRTVGANLLLVGAGLCLLGLGSRLLIDGSVRVAEGLGVTERIIGLTIVAAGTSLPEVVTSIVAALRGERDIAVGNVVGSNIFNILCVLGLSSVVGPSGVAVSSAALAFDIPVTIAVAVACLPIFFSGQVISRGEGGLFFFYYLTYTAYLVLNATENDLRYALGDMMIYFVIPITAVTLTITAWRSLRPQRRTIKAGGPE